MSLHSFLMPIALRDRQRNLLNLLSKLPHPPNGSSLVFSLSEEWLNPWEITVRHGIGIYKARCLLLELVESSMFFDSPFTHKWK